MRIPALFLLAIATPASADPVLHRVVLSSGGVGQFEFEADVTGEGTLRLDVPLDQVDDVLKSLVVEDAAGVVQSVRLPGQQPLSESFRTLPFKPDAFASPEALLASLVGEQVRIASVGARGAILSVSTFDLPAAPGQTAAVRHRLTIATDDGIVSVVLEDTPDIAFGSDALRGQIATALAAIAAQRVQDRRTLTITLAPGPARHVRFGYVVAVPVWKTSYRLTLPQDAARPARLEGFAVVENLSGRDWAGVDVTLTSGEPVLFHTPLYRPVFTERPEAPVAEASGLTPAMNTNAARAMAPVMEQGLAEAPGPMLRSLRNAAKAESSERATPVAAEPASIFRRPLPVAVAQAVAAVDFHLRAPVTASSGQSLLLPIMDRTLPARRVALYQPDTDATHPLVALKLTNDTDGALPPGLVTLFDTDSAGQAGYVGDARLPAIEAGGQRLASFALDQAVTVDMQQHATTQVTGGTVARGTLTLQRRARTVTDYVVTTPKGAARTVVIEQPKAPDDPLVAPTGAAVTTTPEVYRVTQDVPAGTSRTIELVTEHVTSDETALSSVIEDDALTYTGNTEIPAPIRQAIQHASDLRNTADKAKASVASLRTHLADLTADQARIRQNLFTALHDSAQQRRYLATMQAQDTEIEDVEMQLAAKEKTVAQTEDALTQFLAELRL